MQLNNTELQEYHFCYNHLCKVFLRHRFYSFILLGHSVHDLSCCITNEIVRFLSYFCFTHYFEFHPGKTEFTGNEMANCPVHSGSRDTS